MVPVHAPCPASGNLVGILELTKSRWRVRRDRRICLTIPSEPAVGSTLFSRGEGGLKLVSGFVEVFVGCSIATAKRRN